MSSPVRLVRLCRATLFLAAVFLFLVRFDGVVVHAIKQCVDACSEDAQCDTQCLDDFDNSTTCGDYGECAPDCADVCGAEVDCATACNGGPSCGNYNGGKTNGECYGTCGDGMCQMPEEDCSTCSECGSCQTCTFGSCATDANCSAGEVCNGGCCIVQCTGGACGGHTRTCNDEFEPCMRDSDCCSNEICVTVDFGNPLCYATS